MSMKTTTTPETNDATMILPAYEVGIGFIICEPDGFMWIVREKSYDAGKYTFELIPANPSMTARAACSIKVKRSANVRVAWSPNGGVVVK